jgi:integrase
MALRMARPWTHPQTKIIYLRQRTPEDLLPHVVGLSVSLPVGGSKRTTKIGEMVQLSLRTKSPEEGKERHALADAALRRFWQRKRRELEAAKGIAGLISTAPAPTMDWNTSVARFGDMAGAVLTEGGHTNSDANRAAMIAEAARVYDEVAAMLGPELGAAFVSRRSDSALAGNAPGAPTSSSSLASPVHITVKGLWDRFSTAKEGMLAPKTIRRYKPSLESFASHCGDRDIKTIMGDDIFRWAVHRRDKDNILPRVINRNDLAAVKSVFSWATTHQGDKLLSSNPAEGIRLDEPRHLPTRERKFREAEINAILNAALDVSPSAKNPSLSRAKRWSPWLAAYTGARIAELTALHAEDIWQEHGVWIMHLKTAKNRQPRTVPLHQHLIEQGFLKMRDEVGSGPLFYDPSRRRKTNAISTQAELRAQDMADWVRKVIHDPEVDPNHGWRHTFKSRAVGIIDVRIRDHITGHGVGSVGRKYEHPEITRIAEALARFPRYEVDRGA